MDSPEKTARTLPFLGGQNKSQKADSAASIFGKT